MSLIEYAFSLKSTVGLETFVDAVAIGKGKQDLTSMVIRPVRIPVAEACSYLTHAEIVKFLTGSYSLSKAQSSDLFWEAVWPCLLARGWQSEKPKNQAYFPGENDSLVFLTPGVEKFSRKLVKGDHYFDSVKDILRKVDSEPELLKLDTKYDEEEKKEEKGLIGGTKEQQNLPKKRLAETKEQQNLPKKRRCYLQPHVPICGIDIMKFTVVDTSLNNGIFFEFRESRTLPMDLSNKKIVSRDSDVHTSDPSAIKSDYSQDDDGHDQENSRSCMFVDLNFPQQPEDFPSRNFLTDSTNMQNGITSTQHDDFCALKTSADISVPEQPTHMYSKRKSTRNRPPTA